MFFIWIAHCLYKKRTRKEKKEKEKKYIYKEKDTKRKALFNYLSWEILFPEVGRTGRKEIILDFLSHKRIKIELPQVGNPKCHLLETDSITQVLLCQHWSLTEWLTITFPLSHSQQSGYYYEYFWERRKIKWRCVKCFLPKVKLKKKFRKLISEYLGHLKSIIKKRKAGKPKL